MQEHAPVAADDHGAAGVTATSRLSVHLPRLELRAAARFDKRGNRRPCLGDFQKVWDRACIAVGFTKPDPTDPTKVRAARTPHDLRRSGVKHYIDAGVDPHTVMQWSEHRTESMLRRYHIIDLDDLRRAGKRASDYQGPKENVVPLGGTRALPAHSLGKSRSTGAAPAVRG